MTTFCQIKTVELYLRKLNFECVKSILSDQVFNVLLTNEQALIHNQNNWSAFFFET